MAQKKQDHLLGKLKPLQASQMSQGVYDESCEIPSQFSPISEFGRAVVKLKPYSSSKNLMPQSNFNKSNCSGTQTKATSSTANSLSSSVVIPKKQEHKVVLIH
jgi:hypothetical protein